MKQILKSLELIQDGETTITILPEDYLDADYYDTKDCPMARAIKRTLGAGYVRFGSHSCLIEDGEDSYGCGIFYCYVPDGFTSNEHEALLEIGGSLTKRLIKG